YSTNSGGQLLHSDITKGDVRTEVYYEIDAKRHPVFIETTIREGDRIVRERSYTEDHKLHNHIAGDIGVLDQTADFPEADAFFSPAIATAGFGWAAGSKDLMQVPTYFALSGLDNVGGFVEGISYEQQGDETVHVQAGDFRAQRILQKTKSESHNLYMHPQLGIPVKGETKDGGTFVLTSLEIASSSK